jgi:hypothetical protein
MGFADDFERIEFKKWVKGGRGHRDVPLWSGMSRYGERSGEGISAELLVPRQSPGTKGSLDCHTSILAQKAPRAVALHFLNGFEGLKSSASSSEPELV